jgi:hypothetical protein
MTLLSEGGIGILVATIWPPFGFRPRFLGGGLITGSVDCALGFRPRFLGGELIIANHLFIDLSCF